MLYFYVLGQLYSAVSFNLLCVPLQWLLTVWGCWRVCSVFITVDAMICSAGACNKITTTKGLASSAIIATDKVYLKDRCLDPLSWCDHQLILSNYFFFHCCYADGTQLYPSHHQMARLSRSWSWSSLLISDKWMLPHSAQSLQGSGPDSISNFTILM